MSATAIPRLSDRGSTAARAVWAAIEAVEALRPEDLRDPACESIAEAAWQLADDFERRLEEAKQPA